MDFQDRLKAKSKLLENAPKELIESLEDVQERTLKKLLKELKEFKIDENGNLKLSLSNISLIEPIGDRLREIIQDSGFTEAVERFGKDMDEIKSMTDEYMAEVFEAEQKVIMDALYDQIKTSQLEILSTGAVETNVITFKDILQDSIAQSDNFTNLVENLQKNIIGSEEIPGKMVSYAKQNASDAFSIIERTYTTVVADSLGIEFYAFTGGIQSNTRKFCADRVGKVFHKNEIAAWAELDWAGKNKNTNSKTIFSLLGGYKCEHSLTPVGLQDVPTNVLQRNIANGNIKLSDLPKSVQARL